MNIDLRGRGALITGSTAGIGFAIAKGMGECGAAVVLNGRADVTVDRAVARIREAAPGASVKGVVADAGSVDGADALIAAAPEIDILVNFRAQAVLRDRRHRLEAVLGSCFILDPCF
jgi:NAD(P)-dependent dehydrogenase (short-subunit alcohol dehydrogenase family)